MARSVEALSAIRMMRPTEEAEVRALYARCHPGWPQRAPAWYMCMPTLVTRDARRLLGFTSFAVSWPPTVGALKTDALVMYGFDVCVHPEAQGQGIGLALCEERLALARRVGAALFLGTTWAGNTAMLRIFATQGLRFHAKLPNFFPPPQTEGLMYVGTV